MSPATSLRTGELSGLSAAGSTGTESPFVLGGIDTDQPCTASELGADLVRLGIGLQDVPAMALDPWVAAGLSGKEGPMGPFEPRGRFIVNADDNARGACAASERLGRVIGYRNEVAEDVEAYPEDWWDNCDSDCPVMPWVSSGVDLFQTPAGAQGYLEWVTGRTAVKDRRPLPAAGSDAVLVRSTSPRGRAERAWVRRGAVVGTVKVQAPPGRALDADASALAVMVADRIDSAPRTGKPYDIMQVLSAPLPRAQWPTNRYVSTHWDASSGELGGSWSTDWAYYEYAYSYLEEREGAIVAADAAEYGPLVSYSAYHSPPEEDGLFDSGADTELTLYRDASGAEGALRKRVRLALAFPGGKRFDVPGISGAVGVRNWTVDGSSPPSFEGYTWSVYFTHGPTVALVYVATEESGSQARQTVIAAAQRWQDRLERILGATDGPPGGSTLPTDSPAPTVTPGPTVAAGPAAPQPSASTQGSVGWPSRWGAGISLSPALGPHSTSISAGGSHSCALDIAGRAWCWGDNLNRALGILEADSDEDYQPEPVPVAGRHFYITISAGGAHTCGLDTGGQAWCWGSNEYGEIGVGDTWEDAPGTPILVAGGHTITSISAGARHTCALDTGGQAWCWGSDEYGQLGDTAGGPAEEGAELEAFYQDVPTRVGGRHVIDAGARHTCAVDAGGQAWCWGSDEYGQIGDGAGRLAEEGEAEAVRDVPTRVGGRHVFEAIDAGYEHTCAVDTAGAAWCWGSDSDGELGDGAEVGPDKDTPVAVSGGHAFTEIEAGLVTCALDTGGKVWCWGEPWILGDSGGRQPMRTIPVAAPGNHVFSRLTVGDFHVCAVEAFGKVWCWGNADSGKLGAGPVHADPDTGEAYASTPVPVTGGHTFKAA